MRKYRIGLIAALVTVLSYSCDTMESLSDPDLDYFVKYYGGDGHQYGVDMLSLEDGSFILLGDYSVSIQETNIYLVRVDAEGEVLWERQIDDGQSAIWEAKDIERSLDGNFVVLANVRGRAKVREEMGGSDVKLFKVSPGGDVLGSAEYCTPVDDFGHSVTLLADGGFLISGKTLFTPSYLLSGETDVDLGDIFDYRLQSNLEPYSSNDWGPTIGGFGSNLDVAVKGIERIVQLPDNGIDTFYYVLGYTNSTLNGDLNPNNRLGLFYYQRESSGSFDKVFYPGNVANVQDTEIDFVAPLPAELGSGVAVVGTSTLNAGQTEIFFARLRNSLTFLSRENDATYYNTIALGRNLRGVAASPSVTGEFGYLILGDEVRATGAKNIWLSKINQNGAVLWSTTFGSELEEDVGAAVTQLPDGKIMVLGTMGLGDNQFKMALIKLNPEGRFLK